MNAEVQLRNRVKEALIEKFKASQAKSGSIVLEMKVDGSRLIVTPDWCRTQSGAIEDATSFEVYIDVEEGRALLPYLCSMTIEELASKVINYKGINFGEDEEEFMRLMDMAEDFVAEYDMYEEEMRKEVLTMQHKDIRKFMIKGYEEYNYYYYSQEERDNYDPCSDAAFN